METLNWIKDLLASMPDFVKGILASSGVLFTFALAWWSRHKARRALLAGDLRDEVIVTTCIIEEKGDGSLFLKPRTSQSAQPVKRAFPNPALVEQMVAATKKCDDTAAGSFIVLDNKEMHGTFMKRVVDIVSEIGGVGHIVRAGRGEFKEYVMYCCVTFAMDGPHRKTRIDVISADYLPQFLDDEFLGRITNRPEEGSHADLVSIFKVCAEKEFGPNPDKTRSYVRRVSVSVPA